MEIIRDVIGRRGRSALTMGVVAAGVLALTVTGAMAEHFREQFAGGVAYFSANVQVADDAGGYAGVVSLTRIDAIQRVPGVAAALPSIAILARPGTAAGTPLGLPDTIVYADPRERAYSRIKTAIASGRQLDPNRQGEVVLGAGMAGELGARAGDDLDLPVRPRSASPDFVNHTFKVVGILKRTGTLPDATAEVGLLDAQTLLQESLPASFRDRVDPSSLASGITVYGKPGTDLDRLADRINSSVPGVTATRPTDFAGGFDQSARFTAIATATALLALALGTTLLATTMRVAVIERTREIVLKMTFGAHAWHIAAEQVLEATGVALAGGAAGFVLGAGLCLLLDLAGRAVSMDVFSLSGTLAEGALGVALATGLAAGALPALRAARLDPHPALRAS